MKKLLLLLVFFFCIFQFQLTFAQVPSYVPTNGLVAFYPFNGNANDASGNGNNGTRFQVMDTTNRFGNSNSAFYFNSYACVSRIDVSSFNYNGAITSFSISFWIKRTGNGCISPRLFEFGTGNGWGVNWINGQTTMDWINNHNLLDNVWYHITYVLTPGVIFSYVNGSFDSQSSMTNSISSLFGSSVCFGRMNHPSYDAFNGSLDDIAIYNRALTPSEITALYTGVPAPTISYFSPNKAAPGDFVIIKGKNFSGVNAVSFGGSAASGFVLLNDSTIKAVVGAGTSGSVQVTTPQGIADKTGFTYSTGCWKTVCNTDSATVAIKNDGTLWAWGMSAALFGANYGNSPTNFSPTQIGTENQWQSLSNGLYSSIYAIKNDGSLWAWGWDYVAYSNYYNKSQIGTEKNWQSISARESYSLALKSDGTLWSWGRNYYGQIGNGTTNDVATPTQIGSQSDWQSISSVFADQVYHSLAIKNDGTLWGWGLNSSGQLGNGTTVNSNLPVRIDTSSQWIMVSSGTNYSLGLKKDGTLWAWGDNTSGQLGNGSTISSTIPIKIGTSNDWKLIRAVWSQSMAIKNNGTLWVWGGGQSTSPVQLGTETNWQDVNVGAYHNQAIKTDGSMWAWGANWYGQLGNGTTTSSSTPVSISCPVTYCPSVSSIQGPSTVLVGGSIQLTDSTSNGVWSSSNPSIATVNSNGQVSGLTPGTDTIRYTVNTACGNQSVYKIITVSTICSTVITTNDTAICAGSNLYITAVTQTSVTDINGNVYPAVRIGRQTWTQKNLNVSRYKNGDIIPQVTNATQWAALTTGAWCWYNNDSATYAATYGKLYNWYAVNDPRGLAPDGWHVSTDDEWNKMAKILDANADTVCVNCSQSSLIGGYLKETTTSHWASPNTGASNSTLFTALPGSNRESIGTFGNIGWDGLWWTSSLANTSNAFYRTCNYSSASIGRNNIDKKAGFSVRLVQNTPTYLWSTGATSQAIIVTPTVSTTYYCTVSNGISSCVDSVRVTVNTINKNFFVQDTIRACGAAYTLSAGTGYTSYAWSTGATTSSINVTSTGWYKCTITNGTCSATDSVFVSLAYANIVNNDTAVCSGASVTLTATGSSTSAVTSSLPANLLNGLVGYWPFNGNANDESGNGNNGTVNGATLTTDRYGNANSAYSFNGLSNSIIVNNSNSLQTPNAISFNAWVNFLGPGTQSERLMSKGWSPNGIEVHTLLNTNHKIGFGGAINGIGYSPYSTSTLLDNKWYMVTAIDNGLIKYIYINGILEDSLIHNYNSIPITSINLYFGKNSENNSDYLNGKLDNISFYNRALSSTEVQQLYNQGNVTYSWSNGATTPSITVTPTSTTTYYCTVSNGISSCVDSVRVTVNPKPTVSTVTGASRCGTGTVTLSATTTTGNTIDWYSSDTATTPVVSGVTSYTTPSLSATKTYFVRARNTTTGCVSSTSTAVTATINAIPAAPTTTGASRCGSGTVTLSATVATGNSPAWYSVSTGGTALSTSASYTTPTLTATTNYYVAAIGTGNCASATRTLAVATINALPATATGNDTSRCGTGTVTLKAVSASGTTVDWYAASSGGTALLSGSLTYTTPSISATTTYYAQSRNSTTGCVSATRKAISAIINPNVTPTFAFIPYICSGATAPILPSISTNGVTGTWSPAVVNNTTSASYTFTPAAGQCASSVTVAVTVMSNATPTFNLPTVICNGAAVSTLPAISTNGIYGSWSPAVINTGATTTYTFTPSAGQCANTTSVTIRVDSIKTNFLRLDTIKACGASTIINAGSGFVSYLWNTGSADSMITVTETGWYSCTVSNGNCLAKDSVFVSIVNANIINNDTTICGGSVTLTASGNSVSSAYNLLPSNLRNGLVGYWPFNGNANDESGNGNNGTVNGAILTTDRFGNVGKAYNFDGQSTIKVLKNVTLEPQTELSVSCWVYANYSPNQGSDAPNSATQILRKGGSFDYGYHLSWSSLDNRNIQSHYYASWGQIIHGIPNEPLKNGWHNIIMTYSSLTYQSKLYIDGNMVSSSPSVNTLQHSDDLYIGGFNNFQFFSGKIDDIAIYNRALFQSEITQLYNQGNPMCLWSNGATTPTVTVTPTTTTTYYCTVSNGISSCKDSVKITVSSAVPTTPLSIIGPADVCESIGTDTASVPVTYKTNKVANASSYTWTVPTGATLLTGQGDTAITARFSSSFVSGNITVKASNYCGSSSTARTLTVYKRVPTAPAAIQKEFSPVSIAAVTNVCGVSSAVYRIKKVTYATSYNWTLTRGTNATLTHINPLGVNDTAVIITYLSNFTKDTISVKAVSACSITAAKTLPLSAILAPPAVTSIVASGNNFTPCIGNSVTYTAAATAPTATQSAVSVFRWTKPNYTTIISATADSSSVTILYNTGFIGGSISAKAQSACGIAGTAKTVTLQYLPPTPTSIVSSTGLYNACIGNVITYTVFVPAPTTAQRVASVYRWTKPNYTTIVSAAADSSTITVSFNTGYIGGSLTVKGQTACGVTGTVKTQALTHTACATGTKIAVTSETQSLQTKLYPNPTTLNFNLNLNGGSQEKAIIKVMDLQGRVVKTILAHSMETISFGTDLKSGVYMVEIMQGKTTKTIRAIKL